MNNTPGPWEVVRHAHIDGELWLSVNQHADATGMKEWVAEIKYLTTAPRRQWANARLIAAAPDLLDLLKRLRGWDHLATAADGPYWTRELNAAIAKAEGTLTTPGSPTGSPEAPSVAD